jgi:hypothetical protein
VMRNLICQERCQVLELDVSLSTFARTDDSGCGCAMPVGVLSSISPKSRLGVNDAVSRETIMWPGIRNPNPVTSHDVHGACNR